MCSCDAWNNENDIIHEQEERLANAIAVNPNLQRAEVTQIRQLVRDDYCRHPEYRCVNYGADGLNVVCRNCDYRMKHYCY